MGENNNILKTGATFITGLAAGYVISLFMSSSQRDKQRQQIMRVKEQVSPESFDAVTTSLFGKSTKEMKDKMDEVLSDFQEQFDSIKNTAKSFDGKKYQKLVNDFTDRMQNEYEFSAEQIERLRSFLKSDYQKVTEAFHSKK